MATLALAGDREDGGEDSGEAGVLRRALGLSGEDVVALDGLFGALAPGAPEALASTIDGGTALADALGVPPEAIETLYARAHALFDSGRHERAGRLFAALATLDGRRADHWLGLGICLNLAGDAGAASAFATASALRPDWYAPLFHLADLHAHAGERASAAAMLARLDACAERPPPQLAPEIDRLRLAVGGPGGAGGGAR